MFQKESVKFCKVKLNRDITPPLTRLKLPPAKYRMRSSYASYGPLMLKLMFSHCSYYHIAFRKTRVLTVHSLL